MGKSAAQIRRMKLRAAARGEEYINDDYDKEKKKQILNPSKNSDKKSTLSKTDVINENILTVARKLRLSLKAIEDNTELNSKAKRSAKRKAEAITLEEVNGIVNDDDRNDPQVSIPKFSAAKDVLSYLEAKDNQSSLSGDDTNEKQSAKRKKNHNDQKVEMKNSNPYIVFVGQLSYSSTKESVFEYFSRELGIIPNDGNLLKVRLLTHKDTGKSKGMAFVEVGSPEMLHECFKLHQTHLDGRRINVERTCGGSKFQKEKLSNYRKEHQEYISNRVDSMIKECVEAGQLEVGELDEGAVSLCKRHAMVTVEKAITEYLESRDAYHDKTDFKNPSAYFTKIISRIAIGDEHEKRKTSNNKRRRQN